MDLMVLSNKRPYTTHAVLVQTNRIPLATRRFADLNVELNGNPNPKQI